MAYCTYESSAYFSFLLLYFIFTNFFKFKFLKNYSLSWKKSLFLKDDFPFLNFSVQQIKFLYDILGANPQAVGRDSGEIYASSFNFNSKFDHKLFFIFENYVIVKRSSKIFKNSFLKNGILEFRSKALIISILTYFLNDDKVHIKNMIFTNSVGIF